MVGIASLGGLLTGVTGLTLHSIKQKQMQETPIFKTALERLQSHDGATHLLGSPIRTFSVDLSDQVNNWRDENQCRFKIPVKGPNGHGYYFLSAAKSKEIADSKWEGVRFELEIEETSELSEDQFRGKRLIIYDKTRHGQL